jgi:hypothetical protein
MTTSDDIKQNPVLLGMLLIVLFIIIIAGIAYSVKNYINEFNKPNITTKQRVGLWLSIASIVIVWFGIIYLGIENSAFANIYAMLTGKIKYN